MSSLGDPYQTLGISSSAGQEEIRAAYLALLRSHPPEKDPEKFKQIRAAYDQLKDEKTRVERAFLHMDLTDPDPGTLFGGESPRPVMFEPGDLREILLSAGEFFSRDFSGDFMTLNEEGTGDDV